MYYKIGELLAKEAVYSKRDNTVVTINNEDNIELAQEYEANFEDEMKIVLSNMSIPNDDCFKCFPIVRKEIQI